MLSNGAWNAMLKLLEEPPKTTIFILCTTDPQKIPKTILSRVQRYDFNKISFEGIVTRLRYIIENENNELAMTDIIPVIYEEESLQYIAKVSEGGMRDAISMLDKCLSFTRTLDVENVVKALGISDYESLYQLLEYILCENGKGCIYIVEEKYKQGKDLKLFIKQFIQFILDVCKYSIYNDYEYIQIPNTIDIKYFLDFDYTRLLHILDEIIELSNQIKYEQNPKVLIESKILLLCKGE